MYCSTCEPAIAEKTLKTSLNATVSWFMDSGIMHPADGSWGVAERLVTPDNKALDMVLSAFPYHTRFHDAYVLNHRRPDCNFETAWLFTTAAQALNRPALTRVTENILDYLFRRSGLLNKSYPDFPPGVWEWSSQNLKNQFYFDDNGWNCLIMFMLAKKFPELDRIFKLRHYASALAGSLAHGLQSQFFEKSEKMTITGKPELPHWGSLACMAIAAGAAITGNEKWSETVIRYHQYLDSELEKFNSSELAYIMVGGTITAKAMGNSYVLKVTERAAGKLLDKMESETGNIPSEHYEIPNGSNLADLVYTVNWAHMGFYLAAAATQKASYNEAFIRLTEMLIKIQDRDPSPRFRGCWRGLYDFNLKQWGGGDLHEGGSGSIYSGWTNAPIAISIAHCICGDSMLEYL